MNETLRLARRTPLLQSLTDEEIVSYLGDGSFITAAYAKNGVIHFDGEVCRRLEIILSGKVVVERIDESGNLMTIGEFIADDMLGGNLIFSRNPYYPMTVTAREPSVILGIGRERVFELFYHNHEFLRNYLTLISEHSMMLSERIRHYVNKSIRECVMSYLNYERKRQNTNRIALGISKKALAERIGVQRTSLSRELAKMRDEGLIRFDNKTIELLYD
ncbi:MAG: Crp/Fnr family transcriptional regulator [Clostridiales bacterium]|nr:Crp/Fnr family transcriptional regulator [Clostridiales bacterium]